MNREEAKHTHKAICILYELCVSSCSATRHKYVADLPRLRSPTAVAAQGQTHPPSLCRGARVAKRTIAPLHASSGKIQNLGRLEKSLCMRYSSNYHQP